jgi:hypothetical protein
MMSIALAPHVSLTEAEGGMVVLDERRGRYWQLNQTGAFVLRCLLDERDVDVVATTLRERFPDTPDDVTADVRGLVDSLHAAGLVVVS